VNAIRIVFLRALLVTGAVFLSGCATTKQDNDVSSIPWNRPQDWEGNGAMGGFRPPGSPGY
jgi:hypothetical protein